MTEAQKRAREKYDKANTIMFCLKLNKTTDADVIQRLQEVSNRQGYIKDLVRSDMK